MATSQDINYALISALYANRSAGFYNDVYFPIIKYTIVQLFNKKDLEKAALFFTAQDIQDYIKNIFKIYIPDIVITKSVEKIHKTHKNFVELNLMEHGNSFQIIKLWESTDYDNMSEREKYFSNGLQQIEKDYQDYLTNNGTYDDNVSFLEFISDNTEEIIGYFQNRDTSIIDEKYVSVVFFLEYLNDTPNKKDVFEIANQLFWASIIAGYLRSEKPFIEASDNNEVKEYFLDTAILLGMLNLSSSRKERYATEIREIIESSGGEMKVHPLTIEEIKKILLSVEASTCPEPGTDIAEAWTNHKLSINSIAHTRIHLEAKLNSLKIHKFPILGPDQCKTIIKDYDQKKVVEELALTRPRSKYTHDNFREIHDIFIADFIKERRKLKNQSDNPIFITANRDLISFVNKLYPEENYMVSTGKLVLDLWMHNTKPANISNCVLTEAMARCLDMHNARVKSKINEVSRFFNDQKGNFDQSVYEDFIKRLYRRAKNVILTVESDPDNYDTIGELNSQKILDALKADKEYADNMLISALNEKEKISAELSKEMALNEKLNKKERDNCSVIEDLTNKNSRLVNTISKTKDELIEEQNKRRIVEDKLSLLIERDRLKDELNTINDKIYTYEIDREKSFTNTSELILVILASLTILGAIISIIYFIYKRQYNLICISAFILALGVFLWTRFDKMRETKESRKQKAYKKWEEKPANKDYTTLCTKHKELNQRISEIADILGN